MLPVIFAHGLEGSPRGRKATMLKNRFAAICPDLRGMDLFSQADALRSHLVEPSVLVGSSLGGLAALGAVQGSEAAVRFLLLLAPAVGMHRLRRAHPEIDKARPGLFAQSERIGSLAVPSTVEALIIHGFNDEVISSAEVTALAKRSPSAGLLLVHDDHSLARSDEILSRLVWRAVRGEHPLKGEPAVI